MNRISDIVGVGPCCTKGSNDSNGTYRREEESARNPDLTLLRLLVRVESVRAIHLYRSLGVRDKRVICMPGGGLEWIIAF